MFALTELENKDRANTPQSLNSSISPTSVDQEKSKNRKHSPAISPANVQYPYKFEMAVNTIVHKANQIVQQERRERFYGEYLHKSNNYYLTKI